MAGALRTIEIRRFEARETGRSPPSTFEEFLIFPVDFRSRVQNSKLREGP